VEVFGNHVELDNSLRLSRRQVVLVVTGEQWLAVTGHEDRYRLSSHGKVVSIHYRRSARERLLQVLAPTSYPSVALSRPAGVQQVGLNRLVAQHFLPPPADPAMTYVVPKDENGLNLKVENLQWAHPCQGTDDTVAAYLRPRGERHHASRLSTAQVEEVRQLAATVGSISNSPSASE